MRATCLWLAIAIAFCACNTNGGTNATTVTRDTAGVVPDSTTQGTVQAYTLSARDTALLGFYQGLLPCKNCQGIKQTLLLLDSGRFKLEEFTLGKSTFSKKAEGRWVRKGDSLLLTANRELVLAYYIKKDTLRLGYQHGNPVADSVAGDYWIARQPNAAANKAWQQRAQAGVDFYAIGNEPFWNLEIDRGRAISFRIADLPKPLIFNARGPRTNKDSTYYLVDSATGRLEVTIYNEFCSDGMSDNLYEHRVHVKYKNQTFKGCGVYLKRS
jgi:uncharacterized membrane protein